MNIFRTLWLSIKDVFDEIMPLMAINLIWVVINGPLIGIALFFLFSGATALAGVVALLEVLLLAPSNMGMYTVAQRLSEGRVISWRLFFEGFRTDTQLAWKIYGLWMVGFLVIITNMIFYIGMGSTVGSFLLILFLYVLLIWISLLIYIGPLIVIQSDKRIRTVARNAFLMALGRPIFTLVTLILMIALGVVLGLFVVILPLLITFALLSIWGFRATTTLIAEAEARRAALEEKAASNRANTDKGRAGQIRPRD